ncbi:MAG: Ig-like domain-containing protein [Prevotellaceae bacterium]|jgi:hypothetical protein|nr:Ig-like domain-containing protein [Prevotellaceae bacterium]
MKTKNFFSVALAAALVTSFSFTSCKQGCEGDNCDDPNAVPTAIVLSVNSVQVEVGKDVTVTAKLEPSNGKEADIVWQSETPSTAVVVKGKITGVAEGQTRIAVSYGTLEPVFINVTVTEPVVPVEHESLEGSNYYVIYMSTSPKAKIQDKIVADFTPNGEEGTDPNAMRLWIWESTYGAVATSGINSYGVSEGWMKFEKLLGWAGGAYCCYDAALVNSLKTISDANGEGYYLHIAYQSGQAGRNTIFQLPYGADPAPKVALGQGAVDGGGTCYDPGFIANNEWYHYDIPMSVFINQGWIFRGDFVSTEAAPVGQNIFAFLTLGENNPEGTTVEYDAVFIYKK